MRKEGNETLPSPTIVNNVQEEFQNSQIKEDYQDLGPIFLSNSSQFQFCLGDDGPQLSYGLFSPEFSNIMYKNCDSDEDFRSLEDVISKLSSCHSYSPDLCFNPLTILCYMVNPDNLMKIKVRLVYDNCSNVTIVDENTAEELGLIGKECDLTFSGTGGAQQRFGNRRDVKFYLQSLDGKFTSSLIQAATLPKVTLGFERITIDPKNFNYLKNIKDFTEKLPMSMKHFKKHAKVNILLGLPYETHFGPKNKTLGPDLSFPTAFHTPFGSCLSGSMVKRRGLSQNTHSFGKGTFDFNENGDVICKEDEKIGYPDLTQFMRLDIIGITDFPEQNNDVTYEEHLARELITNGTSYCMKKKQYTTCLPWKDQKIQETNQSRSLATAHQWVRRLSLKNPKLIDLWIQSYQELVDNDFVCKVPAEDLKKREGYHYVQTFPVEQPNKISHPVRLVFAANQKQKLSNKSLNEHLFTGPNNLQDLVKLVLRFRSYFYVFNLDISRMFMRFRLNETDQEYLRFFLIKKDQEGEIKIEPYRCSSLAFGLSSSPFTSTFLMQNHAKKYLKDEKFAKAAQMILNNSYIDDVIVGEDTEEGLIDEVKKVKHILEEASLPSHKYVSNSKLALEEFPIEKVSSKAIVSVLGTMWDPVRDLLTFNLIEPPQKSEKMKNEVEEEEKLEETIVDNKSNDYCLTKRALLSTIAKTFDSVGLVSPFLLQAKLQVQECWELNLDWDEELPQDLKLKFREFLEELPQLQEIKVPRCFLPSWNSKITEVCGFADASEKAYAAVIYIVATSPEGTRSPSLAFSKTRVRPLGKKHQKLDKDLSICRMELMAAYITSKAVNFVRSAFPEIQPMKTRVFSDSQVTLFRLQNDHSIYRPFVANRLKAIKELTNVEDWKYVRTDQNFAADSASRGRRLEDFINSKEWWSGPEFLTNPDHDYEKMDINNIQLSREDKSLDKGEARTSVQHFSSHVFVNTVAEEEHCDQCYNHQMKLLDPVETEMFNQQFKEFYLKIVPENPRQGGLAQRFQSWSKLVRVLARIIQFITAAKNGWSTKISKKPCRKDLPSLKKRMTEDQDFYKNFVIKSDQLTEAELLLFRVSQYLAFPDEIATLKKNEKIDRSSALIRLRVVWDPKDCLIRMISRVPSTSLIVLPKKNRISELFVRCLHITHNHAGTTNLVSLVEKKCYLVGGIHNYKRIVRCCGCRSQRKLHQIMAELPIERVATSCMAFLYISCDYCGPFYVYEGPDRKEKKVWILLVCCLVTRYIFAEVIEDCTTTSFLQAFRAYVAICGKPKKVFSDNASYFKSASKLLKQMLRKINWSKVSNELNRLYDLEWLNFCSNASSHAGVIEICVKIFKEALTKAIKFEYRGHKTPRTFTLSQFRVICLEMSSLVNDRPLGLVSSDKEGIADMTNVTPNLLVKGRDNGSIPINVSLEGFIDGNYKDVRKVYQARTKVLRLFWNEYFAGYQRKLKFTPKWLEKFDHEIPKNTFILIKEKHMKPGRFIPGVVVDVQRRKNGLISRLKLKTTEHKGVIERDIRTCFMMEHDYLNITEKNHQCLLQDVGTVDQKQTIGVPVSHLLFKVAKEENVDLFQVNKRGPERIFSTQTFVSEKFN